jgi:hypothetical protein
MCRADYLSLYAVCLRQTITVNHASRRDPWVQIVFLDTGIEYRIVMASLGFTFASCRDLAPTPPLTSFLGDLEKRTQQHAKTFTHQFVVQVQ